MNRTEDGPRPADSAFTPFGDQDAARILAEGVTFNPDDNTHPLCAIAITAVQQHLSRQQDWQHNFGLGGHSDSAVIGKMFGVLIVRTGAGILGYLSAFSGKLANGNHHDKFVGPVFDSLEADSFLTPGMLRISEINREIDALSREDALAHQSAIQYLKTSRKNHSIQLQRRLLEQYNFINKAGEYKNLIDIFIAHGYKQPPAGAGECAGPKLLQHAFQNGMEPLAMAEFWWGLSPKSDNWKHGEFYKPCKEKCAPILDYMLQD